MPQRQTYYDPLMDTGMQPIDQMPNINAIYVPPAPGTYLRAEDVVACLGRMADQYHGEGREALRDAAEAFARGASVDTSGGLTAAPTATCEAPGSPDGRTMLRCELEPGHDGEHRAHDGPGWFVWADDNTAADDDRPAVASPVSEPDPEPRADQAQIARVELYPDENERYWFARAIDADGYILPTEQLIDGIRRDDVEARARAAWPGKQIYWLPDGMGDSLWDENRAEQTALSGHSGRRVPSPRRVNPIRPT